MLKKCIAVVCLLLAIGTAFVLAKADPPKTTHAGDNEATFYHLHLNAPERKQKVKDALHNLIGINQIVYHPKQDSVTVTFDYETMRREWIERAFESVGLPVQLNP